MAGLSHQISVDRDLSMAHGRNYKKQYGQVLIQEPV